GVGGTSVSAQAFAGIMALVDQKGEDAQGNANTVLYPLFSAQSSASCNTNGPPAATCVFNDVTSGTIAMPCMSGTPNCNSSGSNPVGVLSGFDAGTGYDLATGLGSVNVANLVNASAWQNTTGGADFSLSLSPSTVTVARSGTGTVTLTVTANGGFTGTVTPACSDLPSGVTCSGPTVMGSGTSTITFTAASSAMLAPANHPSSFAQLSGTSGAAMLLVLGALCTIFLALSFQRGNRKSSAVLAAAAFALVLTAGCSGSPNHNNGGGGGGGATGTSNVIITATSGSIQRSVVVSLTID